MSSPHPLPADREHSTRSGEGDTGEGAGEGDGADGGAAAGAAPGDEHQTFRQGLLRHFHKQSSAANLTRLTNPAELRRLQEETRCVGGAQEGGVSRRGWAQHGRGAEGGGGVQRGLYGRKACGGVCSARRT